MEVSTRPIASYRSNDKGDLLIGVVISNSIAGWSTWNGEKAHSLITDPALIEYIEAERYPQALRRANEIYPEGKYSAVSNLIVAWLPTEKPFRIIYDKESKREAIEWLREEDWICG